MNALAETTSKIMPTKAATEVLGPDAKFLP